MGEVKTDVVSQLCVGGCGFHGTPEKANFCSLCYKKHLASLPSAAEPVSVSAAVTETREKPKKKSDRCGICNVKLRLAQRFDCKCEGVFCSSHRFAKDHSCSFDYRERAKKDLSDKNPAVVADKLSERI